MDSPHGSFTCQEGTWPLSSGLQGTPRKILRKRDSVRAALCKTPPGCHEGGAGENGAMMGKGASDDGGRPW